MAVRFLILSESIIDKREGEESHAQSLKFYNCLISDSPITVFIFKDLSKHTQV